MSSFSPLLVCLLVAASGKASGGSTSSSSAAASLPATGAASAEKSQTSGVNMSSQRATTGGAGGTRGAKSSSASAATSSSMSSLSTDPAVDAAAPPSYAKDVAPLFELRCVKCHGSPFARNDLRLTTYANVMRGGETGTAVVPGDAEGSLLLKKVEARDKPAMPPRKPLTKAEKELLRRWIVAGAPP